MDSSLYGKRLQGLIFASMKINDKNEKLCLFAFLTFFCSHSLLFNWHSYSRAGLSHENAADVVHSFYFAALGRKFEMPSDQMW